MKAIGLSARKLSCISLLTMFCAVIALPVQAHELRFVGAYEIAFGWQFEPLEGIVAGVPNALFFNSAVADPPGPVPDTLLDTELGDTVKLIAVPFRLDTDEVDSTNIEDVLAHIVQVFPPLSHFSRCDEFSDCEEVGYVKAFTPPVAGAYGAFLVGKLKRHNHDGFVFPKKFFAETFVCGDGTQDPGHSEFECVVPPP